MGQFQSGKWILGLSLYFFTFFLVVYSIVNASSTYGINTGDISVNDPGFQSEENTPEGIGGECTGILYTSCGNLAHNNQDNATCTSLPGCIWVSGSLGDTCEGTIDGTCGTFNNDPATCGILASCSYTEFTQQGSSTVNPNEGFDWGAVKDTIGVLTGFKANIGAPPGVAFIFAFFFSWIPFFMLLWSVYMAIPFLH